MLVQDSPILQMTGICKAFPGVQALDGASLAVNSGEIHGLVGENGAGKSTIIKVLAGVYAADLGDIVIDTQRQDTHTPATVHRELSNFSRNRLTMLCQVIA